MSTTKISRRPIVLAFAFGIACTIAGQALLNGSALANQPFMEAALGNLQAAKANLIKAEANKGGHRERAIDLVNNAINQVEQGIAFAGG